MKRILSMTGILALSFLVLTAFSIRKNPQDPPRGKKAERHIKVIKEDEKGNKVELDTVIHGDQVFVWNGDTIGGDKELKWISEDDFDLDSLHANIDMKLEYEIEDNGNVFIVKSGKGGKHMVHEFKLDGDSTKEFVFDFDDDMIHPGKNEMFWIDKKGNKVMIPHTPGMARVPRPIHAPDIMFFRKQKKENIIDLSDPGIISFKKKVNKDGTEKITIVRKQVPQEDTVNEEVIMHGPDDVMFKPPIHPAPKRIKVIKSDDGKVEVIEDGKTWVTSGDDENVKVIEEDGKVIRIKEIKKDGEKKIDVNVEVKKEDGDN